MRDLPHSKETISFYFKQKAVNFLRKFFRSKSGFRAKECKMRNTRKTLCFLSDPSCRIACSLSKQPTLFYSTCYCTQVNPLFAFMRGLVALILIHRPSNPTPLSPIFILTYSLGLTRGKYEVRSITKYCSY